MAARSASCPAGAGRRDRLRVHDLVDRGRHVAQRDAGPNDGWLVVLVASSASLARRWTRLVDRRPRGRRGRARLRDDGRRRSSRGPGARGVGRVRPAARDRRQAVVGAVGAVGHPSWPDCRRDRGACHEVVPPSGVTTTHGIRKEHRRIRLRRRSRARRQQRVEDALDALACVREQPCSSVAEAAGTSISTPGADTGATGGGVANAFRHQTDDERRDEDARPCRRRSGRCGVGDARSTAAPQPRWIPPLRVHVTVNPTRRLQLPPCVSSPNEWGCTGDPCEPAGGDRGPTGATSRRAFERNGGVNPDRRCARHRRRVMPGGGRRASRVATRPRSRTRPRAEARTPGWRRWRRRARTLAGASTGAERARSGANDERGCPTRARTSTGDTAKPSLRGRLAVRPQALAETRRRGEASRRPQPVGDGRASLRVSPPRAPAAERRISSEARESVSGGCSRRGAAASTPCRARPRPRSRRSRRTSRARCAACRPRRRRARWPSRRSPTRTITALRSGLGAPPVAGDADEQEDHQRARAADRRDRGEVDEVRDDEHDRGT